MTPRERWQLGLAVLTAFIGPAERRAADITLVAGDHDPREVLFGVLLVARNLLAIIESDRHLTPAEILQAMAEEEAGENG